MGKVEDDTMVVKGAAAAAAGGGVTGSVSIPASGSSGTTTGANSAAAAAGAKSTTPPVPGPSASPADFKATLKAYESRVDFEREAPDCATRVSEVLAKLNESPPDQQQYFLTQFLPSFVKKIATKRYMDDSIAFKLLGFIKQILDFILLSLPKNIPEVLEMLCTIFNSDLVFYMAKPRGVEFEHATGKWATMPTSVWASQMMVEIVNYFGHVGGFEQILGHAKEGSTKCPLAEIRVIVETFFQINSGKYFTTDALNSFIPQLQDQVFVRLGSLSSEEIKLAKKEDIDKIVQHVTALLESITTIIPQAVSSERLETLQLDIALKCLQSPFFDKRTYGLQSINTMISHIRQAEQPVTSNMGPYAPKPSAKWMNAQRLIKWIESNNVMQIIFGASTHQHLLSRSSELLRFMAREQVLSEAHITMMWNTILHSHEVLATTMSKVLGDESYFLSSSQIDALFKLILAVPFASMNMNTLSLIHELSKKCRDITHKTAMQELLWTIVSDVSTPAPSEMRVASLNYLQETVKQFEFRPFRMDWMFKIMDSIRCGMACLYCYDLFTTILLTFPVTLSATDIQRVTIEQSLQQLIGEFHLLEICLTDISDLHQKAKTKGNTSVDYNNEVKSRLAFLRTVLSHSRIPLTSPQYFSLWKLFVSDALNKEESDLFFSWLVEARAALEGGVPALDTTAMCAIFDIFCHSIASISTEGAFKCFRYYFCDVNAFGKNIMWSPDKQDSWEVLVPSTDVTGYNTVWKLALSAPDNITQLSGHLLLHLHTKFADIIRQKTPVIALHESFIRTCLEKLRELQAVLQQETSSTVEVQLSRGLGILKHYVSQFDTSQSRLRTHGASTRGKPITIRISQASGDVNNPMTLDTHSNLTVADLRHKIKPLILEFKGPAKDLILTTNKEVLQDDSQTLQQLQFVENQLVIVSFKEQLSEQTVNRSRATSSTPSSTTYTPADADKKAAQLMEVCSITKTMAMIALQKANWFVDTAASYMYDDSQRQSIQAEAEKLDSSKPKTAETAIVNMPPEEHPGFIVSSNSVLFNDLFKLLDLKNPAICQSVWDILMSIPTAKIIMENVRGLQLRKSANTPDWNELLDIRSHFKLLYSLQIIDSIVFPLDDKSVEALRVKWCLDFLTRGGLQHVYTILCASISDISLLSTFPVIYKACLALMLKIVEFFLRVISKLFEEGSFEAHIFAQIPQSSLVSLLSGFDFHQLQTLLLDTVWRIAAQASADRTDGEMATYAMGLIVFCVMSNPAKLFPVFCTLATAQNTKQSLLLCQEPSVRQACAEGLYQLTKKVTGLGAAQFFITQLLSIIPPYDVREKALYKGCSQYFQLLCRLFELTLGDTSVDVVKSLSCTFAQYVRDRPIIENKTTDVDDLLVGCLHVLRSLLSSGISVKEFVTKECKQNGESIVYDMYNSLFAMKTLTSSSLPKCKSRESRIAATSVLVELCRGIQSNFSELLALLLPHHQPGNKVSGWEYHPGSQDKSSSGFVGLTNQGNTCYMNSLMQQLFMIKGLANFIVTAKLPQPQLAQPPAQALAGPAQPEKEKQDLFIELQKMFLNLKISEKGVFSTTEFCNAYKLVSGEFMAVNRQQDVDEFFNILWQRLEQQLKGTYLEKLLPTFFVGALANQIRSVEQDYPYYSERLEDFHVISLDVKHKKMLEEALDLYVVPDKLEGENAFHSDKYNTKINVIKRVCIKRLPPTLILHLKRFEYDYNTNAKVKLNDYLEFPTKLNMRPWTREGLADKEGVKLETEDNEQHPDSYYQYQLAGVIVHSGIADAGHYYSIIKDRNAGKWYEFNDQSVTRFDAKDLRTECFGGKHTVMNWDPWTQQQVATEHDRTCSAYMLFYEKIAEPAENALTQSSEQLSSQSSNLDKVLEENAKFLRDRQFFDETYFDFLLEYHKLLEFEPVLDGVCSEDSFAFKAIQMATVFVIEGLIHAKHSNSLGAWITQLKECFSRHVPACKWFLDYAITSKLIKEILFECPIERVRVYISELVIHVLKFLSPHEYAIWNETEPIPTAPALASATQNPGEAASVAVLHKSAVLRFMEHALDLLEDSRPHWRKFKQYFKVIYGFSTIGYMERQWLISKDIFYLYNDWFMGKPKAGKGPRVQVMDSFTLPDLVEFLATLSTVVKGCYQGPIDEGTTPWSLPNTKLLPPPVGLKTYMFSENFFHSLLEMNYNAQAEAEFLQHCSWEDAGRSRFIIERILSSIVKVGGGAAVLSETDKCDKFHAWHGHLEVLLRIEDSLQEFRIHSVLSPHPGPNGEKSLLCIIHEVHSKLPAQAYSHIKFIVHSFETIPAVRKYFLRQTSELSWISSFLDNKLRTQFPTASREIEKDLEAPFPEITTESTPDNASTTKWRRNSTFLCLFTIHQSLKEQGMKEPSQVPVSEEHELALSAEIRELKEAILYYQKRAPQVEPPPNRTLQEWREFFQQADRAKQQQAPEQHASQPQQQAEAHPALVATQQQPPQQQLSPQPVDSATVGSPPVSNVAAGATGSVAIPVTTVPSDTTAAVTGAGGSGQVHTDAVLERPPGNIDSLISTLQDCIGQPFSRKVMIAALRRNFWSPDGAVSDLLDPDAQAMLVAHAEKERD